MGKIIGLLAAIIILLGSIWYFFGNGTGVPLSQQPGANMPVMMPSSASATTTQSTSSIETHILQQ